MEISDSLDKKIEEDVLDDLHKASRDEAVALVQSFGELFELGVLFLVVKSAQIHRDILEEDPEFECGCPGPKQELSELLEKFTSSCKKNLEHNLLLNGLLDQSEATEELDHNTIIRNEILKELDL